MIRCTNCGHAWNADSDLYCARCGAALSSPKSQQSKSDTVKENAPPQAVPPPIEVAPQKPVVEASPAIAAGAAVASQPDEQRTDATRYFPARPETQPPPLPVATPPPVAPAPPVAAAAPIAPAVPIARQTEVTGETPAEKPPVPTAAPKEPQTAAVEPNRRIVGVLVTYSWVAEGQVFPLLEGRNLIGKDPAQCDICVPQDSTLSAVNSYILYRRNFVIGDKLSMSGTDVDGEPIETEAVQLHNYARIRTGSTYWTFVSVQPPSTDQP